VMGCSVTFLSSQLHRLLKLVLVSIAIPSNEARFKEELKLNSSLPHSPQPRFSLVRSIRSQRVIREL